MALTQINHNSLISVGLALTLAGVVFSAGILYSKVDANEKNLTDFKQDTKENFQALNEKLDAYMEQRYATLKPSGAAN